MQQLGRAREAFGGVGQVGASQVGDPLLQLGARPACRVDEEGGHEQGHAGQGRRRPAGDPLHVPGRARSTRRR